MTKNKSFFLLQGLMTDAVMDKQHRLKQLCKTKIRYGVIALST